jgi:hypothetical protein
MQVLGVNGTPGKLWLALIEDEHRQVVGGGPTSIVLASSASPGYQLRTAREEVARLIETFSIDRVRVLDAETRTQHPPSYSQSVERIGLESAMILGADALGVDVARVNRVHLRSVLGFSTAGQLAGFADSVLTPAAPHWRNGRDLAGLAALFGLVE